jgi:uncharacterized repeat protein (TIGR04138 family)
MRGRKEKTLEEVAREMGRYDVEAYRFVFESLDHLLRKLGERRHVTGAELSEAIRELAIERFGYMARTVFSQWGVNRTGDFGEIVFHLVSTGLMSKTEGDRKSDFKDIYDFEKAFDSRYLEPPPKARRPRRPKS